MDRKQFEDDSAVSVVTLNVNSVNASFKRQTLSYWIKNTRLYQKSTLNIKT